VLQLRLSSNHLDGTLPASILNLTFLEELYVSSQHEREREREKSEKPVCVSEAHMLILGATM